MGHYDAKLTSKGQITLPAPIREFFELHAGDIVDFYLDEVSREVRVRARNRKASELFGSLNAYARSGGTNATVEQMDESTGRALAADDARIKREWREWQEFEAWKRSRPSKVAE